MITAAHAHGAEGIEARVLAGITTIEHGTLMTDEVMDLMKQKGTYHVPTIIAGRSAAEYAKIPGYYHPLVVPKALEIGTKIQEKFARAYKHGVRSPLAQMPGFIRTVITPRNSVIWLKRECLRSKPCYVQCR